MASALDRNQLFSFAKSHREEYETLLKTFVETPTVSSDPATRKTFAPESI